MRKLSRFYPLSRRQPTPVTALRVAAGIGVAIALCIMPGVTRAQAPDAPPSQSVSAPQGYSIHQTVDLGGHMVNLSGADAMYSTLVNIQSGPRVLGQTFELHALPGNKNPLIDSLTGFTSGFGGDPNNLVRLNFYKGKLFEFSGMFRRDRQYFDYDLLGNPNIPTGLSTPIGPSNAPVGQLAWPQVMHSSVLFNTVRRMTDVNLTILPLSKFTYHVGYSHYTMEGPTLSPSYTIAKYDALLEQYQRNGTDEFTGAVDWKPSDKTKVTYEQIVNHYKMDSFFTLNPKDFMVQEADGTRAYLGNWDSVTPYGIAACNTTSMGSAYTDKTHYTILSPAQTPGGLPIINPACAVVTSYTRTQPTRIILPTEILRFQSSALKNVSMNGNFTYTLGTSDLPSYYENFQGLNGTVRDSSWTGGYARSHRSAFVADYGILWQASKTVSLSDQVNYSTVHQPGYSDVPVPTTLNTPKDTATSTGNQTINYSGPLIPGTGTLPHGINGVLTYGYFGQQFLINTLTVRWDATPRASFALGWRYLNHNIGQGVPHTGPIQETDPVSGKVAITEQGGIFNAALRPATNWQLNGTAIISYADNALTPVAARQRQQYRVHTQYRPKPWATISGSFTDRERHNNTNNITAEDRQNEPDLPPYIEPIDHVDHSRFFGVGATLAPNERYGLDLNYAFSDVYTATNICYTSGANGPNYPGTATLTDAGTPNVCPGIFARGSTTQLVSWIARDFMSAPTQSGSVALTMSPNKKLHSDIGYRVSAVDGSQFFNDARAVNGSLNSTYLTPFATLSYAVRPSWIWSAEYNYYGYGEGGPSGAQYCSTTTSFTATVVPCTSSTITGPVGLTEPPSGLTAPRNFHANNVTLGMHYEF